jgi:hypothetical protein
MLCISVAGGNGTQSASVRAVDDFLDQSFRLLDIPALTDILILV